MLQRTLRNFLLAETKARELCVITIGGWISATVFIDHEDLFSRYLPNDLATKSVKSHHWETLSIVDAAGKRTEFPAHFIEVG